MAKTIMNGNQAAAYGVRLSRPQVVSAYPITPQTSVVETLANYWAEGNLDGEFTVVESEYSAMSYLIGAAYAGARAFSATSSHGLAYMHEVVHWAAKSRLPIVMVNVNRAIGAPWCLEPDQGDSLSQRDTGWLQIYCSSVQEILDTVIMAFKLVDQVKMPCMVVYDGFTLSHTYENVYLPSQEEVDDFLPSRPEKPVISAQKPLQLFPLTQAEGMSNLLQDYYKTSLQVPAILTEIEKEYLDRIGRSYGIVEEKNLQQAKTVFLAAGAVSQTVEYALENLNQTTPEEKCGLIKLRLFKPFPEEEIIRLIKDYELEKLIIIDRNLPGNSSGIFYQEISSLLYKYKMDLQVYQLNLGGGVDLTHDMLQNCLQKVAQEPKESILWGVEL